MKLNKLTLKDQKLFERYLVYAKSDLAVFAFPNIYIWRSLFDIRWAIIEKSLCVFFQDSIGCFMYLPPLAKIFQPKVLSEVFRIMNKCNKNKAISRIENIPALDQDNYRVLGYQVLPKYGDYLCAQVDLTNFKGNKFKSQRAAYNYFIKHYDFRVSALKSKDLPECLSLFNHWASVRQSQSKDDYYCGMIDDNRKVIKETFKNYQQLNLRGIVVKVENKIKGFTLGCKINSKTFCVLYEITDLTLKGLAAFIFRSFAESLTEYQFINIMDDSGLENLRKVKLSYHPIHLEPAYIAAIKNV